jgi:integrase/recombinase XerD
MEDNAALLDEFCDALWLEDGLSRNSLDSYRRDLRIFSEWLDESQGKSLLEAEHSDLLAYLAKRFENKIKPRSAARLLSSLKRFYRYLHREGRIQIDPRWRRTYVPRLGCATARCSKHSMPAVCA